MAGVEQISAAEALRRAKEAIPSLITSTQNSIIDAIFTGILAEVNKGKYLFEFEYEFAQVINETYKKQIISNISQLFLKYGYKITKNYCVDKKYFIVIDWTQSALITYNNLFKTLESFLEFWKKKHIGIVFKNENLKTIAEIFDKENYKAQVTEAVYYAILNYLGIDESGNNIEDKEPEVVYDYPDSNKLETYFIDYHPKTLLIYENYAAIVVIVEQLIADGKTSEAIGKEFTDKYANPPK